MPHGEMPKKSVKGGRNASHAGPKPSKKVPGGKDAGHSAPMTKPDSIGSKKPPRSTPIPPLVGQKSTSKGRSSGKPVSG